MNGALEHGSKFRPWDGKGVQTLGLRNMYDGSFLLLTLSQRVGFWILFKATEGVSF